VVFADEPTGNLDTGSSKEILALLRELSAEFGQTIVIVTHDPRAAAIADRILYLLDGQIVLDRRTRPRRGHQDDEPAGHAHRHVGRPSCSG
jgi:putative ABC transport system ATP-binding protein